MKDVMWFSITARYFSCSSLNCWLPIGPFLVHFHLSFLLSYSDPFVKQFRFSCTYSRTVGLMQNFSMYLWTIGHMHNLWVRGRMTVRTKNLSPYLWISDNSRIPEILCSLLRFSVDPSKFGDPRPALFELSGQI